MRLRLLRGAMVANDAAQLLRAGAARDVDAAVVGSAAARIAVVLGVGGGIDGRAAVVLRFVAARAPRVQRVDVLAAWRGGRPRVHR